MDDANDDANDGADKSEVDAAISEAARTLGRKGGLKGGYAKKVSKANRRKFAKRAVNARWAKARAAGVKPSKRKAKPIE